MNTSLEHLSPTRRGMLEKAVDVIVRAIHPEKIILFGTYGSAGDAQTMQVMQSLPVSASAFDLLIITREGDRRSDYELQDIIESRCRDEVAVTAIVHDIAYVNKRITEGQYFFSMLQQEGTLLYDARRILLAKTAAPDLGAVRRLAEKDFARWMRTARDFFQSAEFIAAKCSWNTATFMLHQAAEQCYQAMLLAFTGYKPTTHNLDKLRRYTNRFSIELALLFPLDNAGEETIFHLLSSGYVNARYKEEFNITKDELEIVMERVRRLLDIATRVCCNHFASLGKRAGKAC
jgi:HEPN domain-containing protein